LQLCCSS